MNIQTFDAVDIENLGHEYPDLIKHVLEHGQTVDSRIGETTELRDFRLRLYDVDHTLVGRTGMSDAFAYEEATQLLAGTYDDARIRAVVPRAAELLSAPTAYGPRTGEQLRHVEAELLSNVNSRRAVVYVGRYDDLAALNNPDESVRRKAEMPCTCLWQFQLRGDALDMTVYMRSWDAVWGLSYDVPSFTAVQRAMAEALGVEAGEYTHFAGSFHVYERHYESERWSRGRDESYFDIDDLIGSSIAQTQELAEAALGHREEVTS